MAVAGSHAKAEAERDRAGMVALPLPAELSDTIVFEGKANFARPADIRTLFGFRCAIYVRSAGKRASSDTICATGTPASRNWWRRCPRAAWSFRANAATSYWRDGEVKAADGGPFELPSLRATSDVSAGPVAQGWSSASNTISTKDLRGLMLEFISNSLRRT